MGHVHEEIINLMLARPGIRQAEIAAVLERTPSWICTVMASDTFRARYEERMAEDLDPVLRATIEERLRVVAEQSLERIIDRLTNPALSPSDDFLIKTAKLASDALGYGAKPSNPSAVANVAVVVQVPQKLDAGTWEKRFSPPALESLPSREA
jgi:hypothetical protein